MKKIIRKIVATVMVVVIIACVMPLTGLDGLSVQGCN